MGGFFSKSKKHRSFDSLILDELNKPLIPEVHYDIFNRLNTLEKDITDMKDTLMSIENSITICNENTVQHKVKTNNDLYQTNGMVNNANENIRVICSDMERLVNNDKHLMVRIDSLQKECQEYKLKNTVEGMYRSETKI
jgi:hypothetical protein